MLFINEFEDNKLMERFFKLENRKPKNIQTNNKVWILINFQCVEYQWISLDKLYKLMESFFQIS